MRKASWCCPASSIHTPTCCSIPERPGPLTPSPADPDPPPPAAGSRSLAFHAQSRPAVAEAEAVSRGLAFSRATGSPVYFVHLSTPLAVDLIAEAGQHRVPALAETCPHYLVLDDSLYSRPDAARYLL